MRLPDPLTIDLSDIERMDTVGAWIVYRTVRDRDAKVIGASRDEVSLLKQVGEFDKPDPRRSRRAAQSHPPSCASLASGWRKPARPWLACSASSARR